MKFEQQARDIRRFLRRTRQTLRFGSLATSPILFGNSFPKSGTHLLTQVLQGMSNIGPAVDSGLAAVVTFDGFTGRQRSADEVLSDLWHLLPGDTAYGHVHSFPQAVRLLCQDGWATYFILRDPRDVAVSHVHYIAEMAPNHIHHRYYHEVLQSFPERLEASIAGVPAELLEQAAGKPVLEPLPDLYQRFVPYLDWLERSEVLVLHYEDFTSDRQAAISRVMDHAIKRGFMPAVGRAEALRMLEKSIDPQRSPTFRSGKSGGWREVFEERHSTFCTRPLAIARKTGLL